MHCIEYLFCCWLTLLGSPMMIDKWMFCPNLFILTWSFLSCHIRQLLHDPIDKKLKHLQINLLFTSLFNLFNDKKKQKQRKNIVIFRFNPSTSFTEFRMRFPTKVQCRKNINLLLLWESHWLYCFLWVITLLQVRHIIQSSHALFW